MTTYLSTLVLIFGLGIMIYGAVVDIKERRYPMQVFASTIALGFIYSALSGFFLEALLSFVFFTVLGIWASDKHIMSNGDLWCLSTMFLFVSIRDYKAMLMLIILLFIWSGVVGRLYGRNVLSDYKIGLIKVKAMFYRIFMPVDVKKIPIKETIPFTVILVGALVSTVCIKAVIV